MWFWFAACGPQKVVFECETRVSWYEDLDGDGFGGGLERSGCAAPAGVVGGGGDCDDGRDDVFPGAVEVCDGADQDCDGATDEDAAPSYEDLDGDGFGGAPTSCGAGVATAGDCDDTDADVHPEATEACGGGDDDCDGLVDDADPDVVGATVAFFRDDDGDGFGGDLSRVACAAPAGFVEAGGDCDDTRVGVNPAAHEVAFTGVDEDCDGAVDVGPMGFATAYGFEQPTNPELGVFEDGSFQLYFGAQRFEDGPVVEYLAGGVLRFALGARGPAVPAIADGRSWLRVFVPGTEAEITGWTPLDLAIDPDPTVPCTTALAAGTTCDYLGVTLAGTVDPALRAQSAVVHSSSGQFLALPRTEGRATFTATATDVASVGGATVEEVGVVAACGPDGVAMKFTDVVEAQTTTAVGGDVCFFRGQPGREAELEVCDAAGCTLLVANGAGLEVLADLPGESWAWGDWEAGRTLLVDDGGGAWVRADGSAALEEVFAGETLTSFDAVDVVDGFVAVGVTWDGRVLAENHTASGGVVATALDLSGAPAGWVAGAVAVAASADRVAFAVLFRDPASDLGTYGWTFLDL
jgi:hypothetical protein